MVIRISPNTSPTTFRIFAVLEASIAAADSSTELAFCALGEIMGTKYVFRGKLKFTWIISQDIQF